MSKPARHTLWQAIASLALGASILVILFVMFMGSFSHDESHEQQELREAIQELHKR